MMFCAVRDKRAGFTLIEILIVIAIIAILAGIAVPNFMEARAEAQLEACRKNILHIIDAVQMALVRHSGLDICTKSGTDLSSFGSMAFVNITHTLLYPYLIENGYLASIPVCPANSTQTNEDGYTYQSIFMWPKGSGACRFYVKCLGSSTSGGHVVGNQRIIPWYMQGYGRTDNWKDSVYSL